MQELFDFDTTPLSSETETQLMIHINAQAEQDFLDKIGGANARRSDVGAMVDQYNATNIKTISFAGSNSVALQIWAERCRTLGLASLLMVSADDCCAGNIADICTDGILLDCRKSADYSVIDRVADAADVMIYVLLTADADENILACADWTAVQGVIVCADDNRCRNDLKIDGWLSQTTDLAVFAGVGEVLCEANGKTWYPTPEIMTGLAVDYLAKGCNGLWLNGFCADIFNPDTRLYDIYELCGSLNECVGAKRRHIQLCETQKVILPGADFHLTADIAPVFEGAPVCLVMAADGAKTQDDLTVLCNETQVQYTGAPSIVSRNEKGRLCENHCIPVMLSRFEYYLGNTVGDESLSLCIHNNTKNSIVLQWLELSVNI